MKKGSGELSPSGPNQEDVSGEEITRLASDLKQQMLEAEFSLTFGGEEEALEIFKDFKEKLRQLLDLISILRDESVGDRSLQEVVKEADEQFSELMSRFTDLNNRFAGRGVGDQREEDPRETFDESDFFSKLELFVKDAEGKMKSPSFNPEEEIFSDQSIPFSQYLEWLMHHVPQPIPDSIKWSLISKARKLRSKFKKRIKEIGAEKDRLAFQEWKNSLDEANHPALGRLNRLFQSLESSAPDTQATIKTMIEDIESAADLLKTQLDYDDLGLDKQQYLDSFVFNKANQTVVDLGEKAKRVEVESRLQAFRRDTKQLRDAIDSAPKNRRGFAGIKFEEQRRTLNECVEELQSLFDQAQARGLLEKKQDLAINQEIERLISEFEKQMRVLVKLLAETKEPPVEEMSLEEVSEELIERNFNPFNYTEFAKMPKDRMRDLVEKFHKLIGTSSSQSSEQERHKENRERLRIKVRTQLHFVDAVQSGKTGQATVNRAEVLEHMQGPVQMQRREMIEATTADPEYGHQIREILDFIKNSASVRKGYVLVRRAIIRKNGEIESKPIGEPISPDKGEVLLREDVVEIKEAELQTKDELVFAHERGSGGTLQQVITYEQLAGEQGREHLPRVINEFFGVGGKKGEYDARALWFAEKRFYTSNMISEILARLQRRTKTQQHTDSASTDPVLLIDPIAAAVHRSERHGGFDKDWSQWWLACSEKIPVTDAIGNELGEKEKRLTACALAQFRKLPCPSRDASSDEWKNWFETSDLGKKLSENWISVIKEAIEEGFANTVPSLWRRKYRLYPSEELRKKQESVWKYLACYFDIEDFADKIPIFYFSKTYFPPTSALFYLQNGETIQLKDGSVVDSEGQASSEGETLEATIDQFNTAENAWSEILKMIFKKVGSQLTLETISAQTEEGERGGVLGKWLSQWSAAKIFKGEHMSLIGPFTRFVVYQIAQSYRGKGRQAYRTLARQIASDLSTSGEQPGGLLSFKNHLEPIIQSIQGGRRGYSDNIINHSDRGRFSQRQTYAEDYYERTTGESPPGGELSLTRVIKSTMGVSSTLERDFYEMIVGNRPLPPPLTREGSLVAPKKES